jgi:hypothetical protein
MSKMNEMRVIKDGNAWCFVLPDFENLQVSPSVWVDDNNIVDVDFTYEQLIKESIKCEKKKCLDALENTKNYNIKLIKYLDKIADISGVDWWDGEFPIDEVMRKLKEMKFYYTRDTKGLN